MELSRKVITRHWWKFFGFFLVALLLYVIGALCLVIGLFLTAPIAMIAATYAYEDIFGGVHAPSPAAAAAGLGPTGTVRMAASPPPPPRPPPAVGGIGGKRFTPNAGLAVLVFTLAALVILVTVEKRRALARAQEARARAVAAAVERDVEAGKASFSEMASTEAEGAGPTNLSPQELEAARQALADRLAAASAIGNGEARDKALGAVAVDAAKAGNVELVNEAIRKMADFGRRGQAAHESALQLAKHGLRTQAIEIARGISDGELRDQTLTELAH
jgi:hypothetical protein